MSTSKRLRHILCLFLGHVVERRGGSTHHDNDEMWFRCARCGEEW